MKKVLEILLTKKDCHDNISKVRSGQADGTQNAAVAQSVERRIGSAEVTGPIPVSSFSKTLDDSRVFVLP